MTADISETVPAQQLAEAQARIAELERALAEANETQTLFRIMVDAIPARVFWKDVNLTYLGANRKFAEDAGLTSPEEMLGKSDYELSWREQADLYRADDRAVIDSGVAKINFEEPQTTPDGGRIWLETSKVPLRSAAGETIGVMGTYSDITPRKRDQQALIESQAKAQALIEALPDLVSLVNREGFVLEFHSRSGGSFSYPAQMAVGQKIIDLVPPETAAIVLDKIGLALETGITQSLEYSMPTPNEIGEIHLETRIARAGADTVITITRDVTERRRAAAERERLIEELQIANRIARESSRAKSEFLATMSHELRTPLNAIIGFSDMLLLGMSGPLNEKQVHKMERLKENSRRLLALINDLLDLTRIEAGRVEIVQKAFSPKTLVERLAAQIESLAHESKLEFTTQVSPDMPPLLIGDEKRIEQVLLNLLSNAFKFTEKGSVSLTLDANETHWALVVSDTGIGIPPHAQNLIFEAFRQVDGSFSRAYQGSGLGLSIARDLVRMMDGKITLKSAVGVGSTFTVTLPITVPVAETQRVLESVRG
ncbi:MAG: ATP-binding protein [Anaerolineae bacterium]|nr:ATP-binding protein [Anaerolineae bacterium]NUQ04525.1 PAS domain-containing protein [Anaerolineae bacterium]